ncbi:ABC transporter substrate-binding protein [Bradyrhizobium sp. STM 3566]|uniref:ABC transporter substrate-binding protein n=1 Tax=Bradyrhizobium sp. STM 3566 TaxID=578928 RepID=UPI0038908160
MSRHLISSLSRRSALKLAAGVAAAPFVMRSSLAEGAWPDDTEIPSSLKGSGEIRLASFGGATQDALQKAVFGPFEKATGIKVRAFPTADAAKLKAMVDTGNVEWDVMHASRGSIMNLMKNGDYFEKVDYSLVDESVKKEHGFEYGLEFNLWAQVAAYRTDAFKGASPKNWADFWDIEKFPGGRALTGAVGSNNPEMEFALMAAGVPAESVYPINVDKALESYSKIKQHVIKWWDTGAQPAQLLTDGEVVMTTVFSGRMEQLQKDGVPVAICWNQGLAKRDAWGVPKGAKNKINAMKFVAYSTMARPQARFALAGPFGTVNEGAIEYLPPQRLAMLPSAPEIKKQLVPYSYDWWIANREAAVAKFNKWLLS